ncbi:hypothetical protein BGZ95_007236 [Linnemannia exigua]|uniref:HCP-like protein n=1 Tax=Linnemannia exigua TaxID=604196 RepID=A0AAD4DLC8_9FUNG|nr:hypothetical protein BGZ95_007236 [Linnemannia exigua]
MVRGLLPADDDQALEDHVQAIRSVSRNIPPTEVSPARPEEIYYVDCQVDPVTQKEFILWDDILQAFEDGVHVRNKAKIVPFLKGPDFRVLEPRRIAPAPNTVLDVIVREQLTDSRPSSHQVVPRQEGALPLSPPQEKQEEEEEEKLIEEVVVAQNVINTIRRDPVYGLEEEAMDNYSHIDKPIDTEGKWPIAIIQALAATSLQEKEGEETEGEEKEGEEEESRAENDTVTQYATATSTIIRNPVYGLEEAAMDNYSHIDPADADITWSNNIPKISVPVSLQDEEANKSDKDDVTSQISTAISTPRRNPVYGLVEAAMENYTHIDRPPPATSARGPQALMSAQSPIDEDFLTFRDSNAHSFGPQEYHIANGRDLVQTIIDASRGNKEAQVSLGDMYKDGRGVGRDYLTAMDWYQQAARQGDAVSLLKVGVLYEQGLGVTQDYSAAMDWYLKAAEQGNAEAQCSIGTLYEQGHGMRQNFPQAMAWYLKAAEQGFARAQCNVGVLFERGQGVSQDYSQALEWYLKAAEQGHPHAQCNSGELYETGEGVPVDNSKALKWYRKAAEQGLLKAKKRFEDLDKKMHDF